jgi:hypothetical protein
VEEAVKAAIIAMHPSVPQNLSVHIHLPKPDWKMKVVSIVIKEGATAWNMDIPKFEKEVVPKVFSAVQEVILK